MIWNLGSINVDNIYALDHLPIAGETIAADRFSRGLGGKGANMSVAAARAAGRVAHIGAVGSDGKWTVDRLLEYGVDTRHIAQVDVATGHAIINVDLKGENNIVLFPGANRAISDEMIGAALTEASPRDYLLMQNETNGQFYAAKTAKTLGLKLAYAAAPFSADAILRIINEIDLLVVNAVEAAQLQDATGQDLRDLGIEDVIVTLGAEGCRWVSKLRNSDETFPAYAVEVVDTTGAGDTFTGYLVAGLDRGLTLQDSIDLAMQAGALMVSRAGTADVIPDLKDIQDHGFS